MWQVLAWLGDCEGRKVALGSMLCVLLLSCGTGIEMTNPVTDKDVRRAIEDKKFQLLGTEIPSYTFADLKRLGSENMNNIIGYVNDNVNLSRFM